MPPRTRTNTDNPFASFLNRHADALSTVKDRSSLSTWHRQFAHAWASNARALADEANKTLHLAKEQRLVADVGYLAVESALQPASSERQTYILVSTNPGWNEQTSARERKQKGYSARTTASAPVDLDQYERFRSHFFPEWHERVIAPTSVGNGAWWTRANRFLHEVAGVEHPGVAGQWHASLDAIGWELWPFHSASDGLTAASSSSWPLQRFAGESLRAALRMPSKGVVVASRAGFDILRGQLHSECHLEFERHVGDVFCMGVTHRPTRRRVVSVRRQIFSRWGVLSKIDQRQVVALCREFIEGS